jgi:uncharacterized protein
LTAPVDPDNPIDAVGVRVLGSLVEKEGTTPDNYPLTLNALTAACNQLSNRDPVMKLDEAAVADSLVQLARRSLVREVYRSDSRVKRYRHLLSDTLHLHPAELAVMCVLMLRGPQTAGELRTRTARLFDFTELKRVEITLDALATLSTPLVAQLPRRPGQKEVRFAHLLSGEPADVPWEPEPAGVENVQARQPGQPSRIDALEHALAEVRAELAEMRAQFDAFRREFQ